MQQILSNFEFIGIGIATLLNLVLGFYVYFKNPKNSINRIFLFLSLSLCVWCVAILGTIYFYSNTYLYALFDKIAYISGSCIAIIFYIFTQYYPYKKRNLSKVIIISFSILAFILGCVALFSNYFVIEVSRVGDITTIKHNPMTYIIYSLVITIPIILGIWELWKKMKEADGVYRQHFLTLIILVTIPVTLSLFFNIFLSGLDNYTYASVGPISSILFIFAIMRMILTKE